jgi:hypothetical protein
MTEKAKKLGDEPANHCLDNNEHAGQIKVYSAGLTKRELFAAMAMQGIITYERGKLINPENTALHSVKFADTLLEELSKIEKDNE